MGKFFSDAVEQALRYVYYEMRLGKGQEGFNLLREASAEGDGDASCILARCYAGRFYVWTLHRFPVNDAEADRLIRLSVEQGSALGVLVALRSGQLSPELKRKMPFSNLKEAFDVVLKKAEAGDAFCQYTIGNSYFWWDFLSIQGVGKHTFSTSQEYLTYFKENVCQCEGWFLKALKGGMYLAANNLCRFYDGVTAEEIGRNFRRMTGDDIYKFYGKSDYLIEPRPECEEDIYRMASEAGFPSHQYNYAVRLEKAGKMTEALYWFKEAAEGGELDGWHAVGLAYEQGKNVPQDLVYAAECFERSLGEQEDTNAKIDSANRLGAFYYNGDGVVRNYDKAFELLSYAYRHGSTWGVCYLGKLYFRGRGTEVNYVMAREMLEKVTWNNKEAFFMLGYIYGRGLGVPEDIDKAVEYLRKAGDNAEGKAELKNYRRTLMGKWVRR